MQRIAISKITSGLGNQLFQYAMARAFALKTDSQLFLDLRYYNKTHATDTLRHFKLNHFNIINNNFANHKIYVLLSKATKLIPKRSFPPFFECVRESDYAFDPKNQNSKSAFVYFSGFWHSEKYFLPFASEIRRELSFKENNNIIFTTYATEIANTEVAISLHIRRGDLVMNADFNKKFGVLPIQYYSNAFEHTKQIKGKIKYFIFTDDPKWVKENLIVPGENTLIENTSDIDDLQLMSLCHHHIIANSTFSWWGAWLNPYADKMVIAPSKWYADTINYNTKDVLPEGWIKCNY